MTISANEKAPFGIYLKVKHNWKSILRSSSFESFNVRFLKNAENNIIFRCVVGVNDFPVLLRCYFCISINFHRCKSEHMFSSFQCVKRLDAFIVWNCVPIPYCLETKLDLHSATVSLINKCRKHSLIYNGHSDFKRIWRYYKVQVWNTNMKSCIKMSWEVKHPVHIC